MVRDRSRRPTKKGGEWLALKLSDCSATLSAKAFDNVPALFDAAVPGTIVRVRARFESSPQWGDALIVEAIRAAAEGEYDPGRLLEVSPIPLERLEGDLRQLLETIRTPDLSELLARFFAPGTEAYERFRDAPAAKHYHQAYRHGLLEHALSVAQSVSAAASFFPGIDRDIAVTGALLHDIGKLEAYNDDPLAIDLTDLGRLQGEIPLGYYRVRREIERIDGFDPGLAQAVLHIILSHHGSLEHGSPVVPATREAVLVHMMDNLGGKLGSFDRVERSPRRGPGLVRLRPRNRRRRLLPRARQPQHRRRAPRGPALSAACPGTPCRRASPSRPRRTGRCGAEHAARLVRQVPPRVPEHRADPPALAPVAQQAVDAAQALGLRLLRAGDELALRAGRAPADLGDQEVAAPRPGARSAARRVNLAICSRLSRTLGAYGFRASSSKSGSAPSRSYSAYISRM